MNDGVRVGLAIRDLRRQRNLTGEELGKKVGLSQSKISKIETGATTSFKTSELEAILNILEAPQTIRQQILEAPDSETTTHVFKFKTNYQYPQALELLRNASYVRTFVINFIPALLQTGEYRQALIAHRDMGNGDFQRSLATIMKRQDMLWDKHRQFHFILHEVGLYTTPGSRAIQVAQLDRVERIIGVRHIKIGIIPLEAGLAPAENGTFVVYDESRLIKGFADGEILTREAADITTHLKIFTALDKLADYGDSARIIVRKAVDYFS